MSIYLGNNKVNAKAPARLTDITVSASDKVQEFYADPYCDTMAGTTTNSASPTISTGITFPSFSPVDNVEYRITGNVIIEDTNDVILESYDINTFIIWNTNYQTIMTSNSNIYVSKIEVKKSAVKTALIRLTFNINDTYKIIQKYSLYEISDYAGINKVTVEATPYTDTLMKNYIARSIYFTNIEWPDGLTKIGEYAFANCTGFCPSSLPSGITSIGAYAFYYCTYLALTSLPSGVVTIGGYAFYNCTNLALTSLPSGITSVGNYAFYNCTNLALTSLPSGITSVGSYTFSGCTNIVLTSLPSSITFIGSYTFQNCTSLTTVECLGAITTLASNAFAGSSGKEMSLSSVSFPNMSLSSLSTVFGNGTVANACHQLAFADIGSTKAIAANAFANCYALQTLVLRRSDAICSLSNVSAFTNTPMNGYNNLTGTVYVPSALISTYQTATNWSTLYNNGTVTFAAIEGSEHELD